jgi:hypothetical protein
MTQSLTARLQERQATQSAEIERITASELNRLGQSLRAESELALSSMQSAMAESMASTTASLERDLSRLRRLGRWWWGTLLLSWATIAMLMAFSLWLWMSPGLGLGTTSASDTEPYPTFTQEGRTYMVLPSGTQATTCQQGEQVRPCVVMPSLAMRLGSTAGLSGATEWPNGADEGASGRTTEPTSGTPTGRPGGSLSVRPPTRPDGS